MIVFLSSLAIFLGIIFFAFSSWRNIEYSIYAIIFSLPLYLVRLNIFGIPSTILELGIYELFIIWLVKNNYSIKFREILPDKAFRAGVILLLAGAAISTVFSHELRASAGILKGWFFDPFLLFILIVSEIKTLRQKENILKAFFFSGALVAILSLIYLKLPFLDGVAYDGRLHGFYLSPNHLAMFLSPALIAGIWFFYRKFVLMHRRDKINNIMFFFSIILIGVMGLAIYFTYSYAAWLAIFVSLISMIYWIIPPIKRKILLGGVFLSVIVLFLSQNGTSKFENLKNLSYRSSYTSRLMIWRAALEIGKDNFLIGIGPGNFQKYYLDYQARFPEPYLEWAVPEPHNIFLAFWLETGIMGLFGFLIILIWFLKYSISLLKSDLSDKENLLLVAVLLSIMVYTITHGLFDTTYWKNDLAIIFWLDLALLPAIKKQPDIS